MTASAPPDTSLDLLLNLIAARLDLTRTQRQDAVSKYEAVHRWLIAPGSNVAVLAPVLYPQGSFRLDTAVKPRAHEEYDLDLVAEFQVSAATVTPQMVYGWVEFRLSQNETYKGILERKNRCLRLNYAGQFHMDILPACPDPSRGPTALLVPDRKTRGWTASNPKGFAAWFEARMESRAANRTMGPVPSQVDPEQKHPLQRTVQLIKRQRDQVFDNVDLAPASIVLTTLAGWAYDGQSSTSASVSRYLGFAERLIDANPSLPFRVLNPTNEAEILSERWESVAGSYAAFCRELRAFKADWTSLLTASNLSAISIILKRLFGEDVATRAVNDFSEIMGRTKEQGGFLAKAGNPGVLYGASAGLTAGARRIPPNTNFGEPR